MGATGSFAVVLRALQNPACNITATVARFPTVILLGRSMPAALSSPHVMGRSGTPMAGPTSPLPPDNPCGVAFDDTGVVIEVDRHQVWGDFCGFRRRCGDC
jgi:hypothetical protein